MTGAGGPGPANASLALWCLERPLVSGLDLYARRNLGRKPVASQREHQQPGSRHEWCRSLKGSQLPRRGCRVCHFTANLDEVGLSRGAPNQKVNLVASSRADVRHFVPPSLQLDQNGRLQGVSEIRPIRSVEDGNEPGVDRVRLPGVHHALAYGPRLHPNHPDKEAVLEVREKLML